MSIKDWTEWIQVLLVNLFHNLLPFPLVLESIFHRWTLTMSIDCYSTFSFFTAKFDSICFCFLIGCIQQFHWLIILSNNFFTLELNFFQLQNGKKISSTRKINYSILSRCACAKLKIFLSAEKLLKWIPAFRLLFLVTYVWIVFIETKKHKKIRGVFRTQPKMVRTSAYSI